MFEVGNLATGVVASVSTERFDLIDNDIIDAADITEWLSLAATTNGYSSRYLRGDTDLDHDVATLDLTGMIVNYTVAAGASVVPEPTNLLLISLGSILLLRRRVARRLRQC